MQPDYGTYNFCIVKYCNMQLSSTLSNHKHKMKITLKVFLISTLKTFLYFSKKFKNWKFKIFDIPFYLRMAAD